MKEKTLKAFHNDPKIKAKYLARVKAHYDADEKGCWIWQKALTGGGYGISWYKGKSISAHRLSYLLFKGEIPKGMCILHSCDNKRCINPEHLSVGTNKENTQDALRKGRMALGERQGSSILTTEQVVEIKKKLNLKVKIVELANLFGVDETTIGKIKAGVNWKHI